MKLAMVSASLSRTGGGVSAALQSLSRQLEKLGADVRVFGLMDAEWSNADRAQWTGAPAVALPTIGPRALGYSPGLTQALVDWKPDIVHSHGLWMHNSRSVLQWSHRTGRPYVISPHGMLDPWAVRNSRLKKYLVTKAYEAAHLREAAAFHALCEPEAAAIRAFGIKNPIHVVPNGVDLPKGGVGKAAPWKGRIPEEAKVMLFLGRIHPKKNLIAFISAWSRATSDRKGTASWRLIIAGWDQGGHEQELKSLVKTLGIEKTVVFTGPLFGDMKDSAFRNADAFVLPSKSEGVPVSVLEALSYGKPVLMTTACNLDIIFYFGAGKRLSLSPVEMQRDLEDFLKIGRSEIEIYANRAVKVVENLFLWPKVAKRMLDVYQCSISNRLVP
ncbi:glycosyltransferase [Mesorhizobium escarrei]|uniref:Poly(Glycerol-phosphate) alpha-glucosyltransferase n=1 Tax=Mesorhizobium escarrei TaxID=666018 RepID=A0ABM9EB63_9HYPH|nr:glycosyltransferase [Mesorhizobium escarrei]CAH2406458.1 Poly(Glycerol-phosphate) alpha-glucosyltransferase [Mesorhizobium escarrei]